MSSDITQCEVYLIYIIVHIPGYLARKENHISWQLHVKTCLYHTLQPENSTVVSIGKMALLSATSMGRNMSYLRHNFDICCTDSLSQCVNRVHSIAQICSEYQAIVNHVKSLLSCAQGESYIDGFYYEMLNILLTGQVVCIIVVLFHQSFVFLHTLVIMLNVP